MSEIFAFVFGCFFGAAVFILLGVSYRYGKGEIFKDKKEEK